MIYLLRDSNHCGIPDPGDAIYRFQNENASFSVKQILKDRRKMEVFWTKRNENEVGRVVYLVFLKNPLICVNQEEN